MRAIRLIWALKGAFLTALLVASASSASAQVIDPLIPVVTIRATQPFASRATTNSGVFTVFRAGNPTNQLNVFYRLSGTASNGVDYEQIGPWVIIPAGAYSASIKVTPINNGQTDAVQTVIAELAPSPFLTPVNYEIGYPSNAEVYIFGSNSAPLVRITSPPDKSIFRAPVDIPLLAYAFEPGGLISSVQFFANGNSLGFGRPLASTLYASATAIPIITSNIFALVWSNAPVGPAALTVVATDTSGDMGTSAPVNIIVLPPLPPPTNKPPIVDIVAVDPLAIEGTNCWPWLGLVSATPTWSNWTSPGALCRWFTNCGPKDALFRVRRFGETNDDLTVTYSIGGTATNGVDYVTLSGIVTIPAGDRSALIPLVPLDDGKPDITSTVILKLNPSTNTPPDYVVGFPPVAAALILDSRFPCPPTEMLSDKCFHVSVPGPNGAWFHIECTTDLSNWVPLCTNQVVNGYIDFVDPDAAANSTRFYRAVPEAGPGL